MPDPILHKYFDLGDRALANLTLKSGERVLLTILPAGFAVHLLHVFGIIPGRCLFGIKSLAGGKCRRCSRATRSLAPLPRAKGKHQDDAERRRASHRSAERPPRC
jgi:hypothetical protein